MYVCTYVCMHACMYVCMCVHMYVYMYVYMYMYLRIRDLQYISISQYIDTLVEYRIVIRCSMNIEISDNASSACFMLLI